MKRPYWLTELFPLLGYGPILPVPPYAVNDLASTGKDLDSRAGFIYDDPIMNAAPKSYPRHMQQPQGWCSGIFALVNDRLETPLASGTTTGEGAC